MSDSNSDPTTPKPRTIQALDIVLFTWMNDCSEEYIKEIDAMFDGDQLLRPKLESLKEDLPDMLKATNPVQKKRVRYNDIGDLVSKINRMHLDTYMLLQMLESLRELAEGIRETVDQAC